MASPYRGRAEWAASGSTVLEIDDLDSATWRGAPAGSAVFLRSEGTSYPWLVGVILLEGPRAGEYATADLVVEEDPLAVRFEGRSAFAPTLSRGEVEAAMDRAAQLREKLAMMRGLTPRADGRPVFSDPRVSALDRPRLDSDESPEHMTAGLPIDQNSVRLVLEHEDHRVYLARGLNEQDLFLIHTDSGGGGASGGPFSNLATYGLTKTTSMSSRRSGAVVYGAVPDDVIAVRVDDMHAVMGENSFVAVMPDGPPIRAITVTTREGNIEVPLRSPLERP